MRRLVRHGYAPLAPEPDQGASEWDAGAEQLPLVAACRGHEVLAVAPEFSAQEGAAGADPELAAGDQAPRRPLGRTRLALAGAAVALLAAPAACVAAGWLRPRLAAVGAGSALAEATVERPSPGEPGQQLPAAGKNASSPKIPPCPEDAIACPGQGSRGSGGFLCPAAPLACRDVRFGPFPDCPGQCFVGSVPRQPADELPSITPLTATGSHVVTDMAPTEVPSVAPPSGAAAAAARGPAPAEAPAGGGPPPCAGAAPALHCPAEWRTGATGGYFCEEGGGCRGWAAGPFANCPSQCSIGNVPATTTAASTTAPAPTTAEAAPPAKTRGWDLAPEAGGREAAGPRPPEGANETAADARVQNGTAAGGAASGAASAIPECSGAVSCPVEWRSGPTGGYYCSDGNGCQEWAAGPFEGCPSQCSVGRVPPTTATTTELVETTTSTVKTTAKPWGSPSLLCFSVARCGGELDIVRRQGDLHAGIFACDMALVVTDVQTKVGGGVEVLTIPPISGGVSKDGTAANTEVFLNAWNKVQEHGEFKNLDWTVKVDPDAVLLPDRLRSHLSQHSGALYIKNCNKYPGAPEWPMMFGAMEALSREAVEIYFGGAERCRNELSWQDWGEDVFLSHCLDLLGVGNVGDYSIIGDDRCDGSWCSDGSRAAFHPFKDTGAWEACWNEATR